MLVTNYVLFKLFFQTKKGPAKKPRYLLFREKNNWNILYWCLCIRKYLFVYSVEEGVPIGHTQDHMGMQIRSLSLEGLTRFDAQCH